MRISRFLASTGVRLAFVQTLLLVSAFAIAGSLTKVSVNYIYQRDVRARIQGEVSTLAALDQSRGVAEAAAAVARAEHRPGGLEYRLTDAAGHAAERRPAAHRRAAGLDLPRLGRRGSARPAVSGPDGEHRAAARRLDRSRSARISPTNPS